MFTLRPQGSSGNEAVRRETAQRKARHDAQELDELADRMARFSPRLADWSQRLQRTGRSFALNVSNVHGPDRAVTVLGAPTGRVARADPPDEPGPVRFRSSTALPGDWRAVEAGVSTVCRIGPTAGPTSTR